MSERKDSNCAECCAWILTVVNLKISTFDFVFSRKEHKERKVLCCAVKQGELHTLIFCRHSGAGRMAEGREENKS